MICSIHSCVGCRAIDCILARGILRCDTVRECAEQGLSKPAELNSGNALKKRGGWRGTTACKCVCASGVLIVTSRGVVCSNNRHKRWLPGSTRGCLHSLDQTGRPKPTRKPLMARQKLRQKTWPPAQHSVSLSTLWRASTSRTQPHSRKSWFNRRIPTCSLRTPTSSRLSRMLDALAFLKTSNCALPAALPSWPRNLRPYGPGAVEPCHLFDRLNLEMASDQHRERCP